MRERWLARSDELRFFCRAIDTCLLLAGCLLMSLWRRRLEQYNVPFGREPLHQVADRSRLSLSGLPDLPVIVLRTPPTSLDAAQSQ